MGRVKKSKCWCTGVKRNRDIWDKFYDEKNKDKRIYLPEIKMKKEDVAYIKESARRKNVTPSCQLETMIHWAFIWGVLPSLPLFCAVDRSKKHTRLPFASKDMMKRPKYLLHPSYVEMMGNEGKIQHKSLTVIMAEICYLYRQKYPVFIFNHLTPPFLLEKII